MSPSVCVCVCVYVCVCVCELEVAKRQLNIKWFVWVFKWLE